MSHPPRSSPHQQNTINKTKVINPTASNPAGFHCNICQATFTSYDSYLDHCHSKVHLRNAGITEVERVDDVERIRNRLKYLKEQKEKKEGIIKRRQEDLEGDIKERIRLRIEEDEAKRRQKYDRKKEKKSQGKNPTPENETEDEEAKLMASVLGISSFKS